MASTTAKGKYPEQLIAMVSAETKAFIRDKAAETDRSISEVARDYLEAGINHEAQGLLKLAQLGILPPVTTAPEAPTVPRKSDPTFF